MTRPSFPRRFWRSLTGRRTGAETCRPVTVTGDDGQPVHTMVLGGQPMSEAGQAALGEIVRAAQRKHRQQLHEEREQQARDVLAVAAVATATAAMWSIPVGDTERRQQLWSEALDRIDELHARFADRIAALDARDARIEAEQ